MKRHLKLLLIFALLGIFSTLTPLSFAADNTIIAVVNDELIALKDLQDYLTAIAMQLEAEGKSPEEINKAMESYQQRGLERLIEDKLLVIEADRKQMVFRNNAVEDKLNELKRRYASPHDFEQDLLAAGLTISDLKKKILDQLKSKYIVEMEVKAKVFVNPQEVTDYYQKNPQNFLWPEQAKVQSIFIPYENDKKLANQKAKEALHRLKKGEDFIVLEKEYSKLPSIGMVLKGQLLPALEDAIFSLNANELSPAIEVENGIYIFKLIEKIPPQQASLEDAKNSIRNQLFQEKFQERLRRWLDELKKKAYIEIKK
ncbi:MAG: peptidyl-prolyl cis-trans isomerase [Candidatus Omnitrophota bacterium]